MRSQINRQAAALAVVLCGLVRISNASASFPAIQPIIGFSTICTEAYDTPVNNCDDNDFSGIGGTQSCSTECETALESAQTFIQRACAGEQASASSLIGNLFVGNVVNFLCSSNGAAASSTTTATTISAAGSSAAASTSMASDEGTSSTSTSQSQATISTDTIVSASSETSTTSTESTTASTDTTTSSSSSESSSSSTSSTTDTTLTSVASTTSSQTSTATSSTSTSSSNGSDGGTDDGGSGGGSPFDGNFSSGAGLSVEPTPALLLLLSALLASALFTS